MAHSMYNYYHISFCSLATFLFIKLCIKGVFHLDFYYSIIMKSLKFQKVCKMKLWKVCTVN